MMQRKKQVKEIKVQTTAPSTKKRKRTRKPKSTQVLTVVPASGKFSTGNGNFKRNTMTKVRPPSSVNPRWQKYFENMMEPKLAFTFPRFVPYYHGSYVFEATKTIMDNTSPFIVVFARPEFNSAIGIGTVETVATVALPSNPKTVDFVHSVFEGGFDDLPICYNGILSYGETPQSTISTTAIRNNNSWLSYQDGAFSVGPRGYNAPAVWQNNAYMDCQNNGTVDFVANFVLQDIAGGNFLNTVNQTIIAGSKFTFTLDAIHLATLDFSQGFICGIKLQNPSDNNKFTMELGYFAGNALMFNDVFAVTWSSIPDLLGNSAGSIQSVYDNSSKVSVTAMSVRMENTTAELVKGGNIVIAQRPSGSLINLPASADLLYSDIGSLRYHNYRGQALKGGHWFYVPENIDNLQYHDPVDKAHLSNYSSPTPYSVFVVQKNSFTDAATFMLSVNFAIEFLTEDQSVSYLPPIPTYSLGQTYLSYINACCCVGENPSHTQRIKEYASRMVKSPAFQQAVKTIGTTAISALLI